MGRPIDLSKLRGEVTKSIKGISAGFRDPDTWIGTGNYALNYLVSGDFYKGVPLGKVSVVAGAPGSGKSYICSGNIIKNAQAQDVLVILIDTENALDEKWLKDLGVDTSPEKLLKFNMDMIDDVAKCVSIVMDSYFKDVEPGEGPKILFVIDSLGMTRTETDKAQFEKGELKGDLGRHPKALKALVKNCVNQFGVHNVGMVATNHTYASQDMFNPDPKISGGNGFIYAASIVIAIDALKLKEDEDGNKIKDVKGIRANCKVVKTRYSKPFETVQIKIPYDTGMNPYSGLVNLFENQELLKKQGNRLVFVDKRTGEEILQYRKAWERNEEGCLDTVMKYFEDAENGLIPEEKPVDDDYDDEDDEEVENDK